MLCHPWPTSAVPEVGPAPGWVPRVPCVQGVAPAAGKPRVRQAVGVFGSNRGETRKSGALSHPAVALGGWQGSVCHTQGWLSAPGQAGSSAASSAVFGAPVWGTFVLSRSRVWVVLHALARSGAVQQCQGEGQSCASWRGAERGERSPGLGSQ